MTFDFILFFIFIGIDTDIHKDRVGIYRICIAIWILTGLAWFAAIIAGVQETMEKTGKKIADKEDDSTRDVNGNQETLDPSKQDQNGILGSKEGYYLDTKVHSFTLSVSAFVFFRLFMHISV